MAIFTIMGGKGVRRPELYKGPDPMAGMTVSIIPKNINQSQGGGLK
jgi:hypothetical protein